MGNGFVAELLAKSPCAGLLPLEIGTVSLTEVHAPAIWSVSAYRRQAEAAAHMLQSCHGMAWPAPNRSTGRADARAVWFGRAHIVLVGPIADPKLAAHAALTDQSDAWAVVRLEGPATVDVLARLVPIDLRQSAFKRGHTARTELQHMSASITRVGDQAIQVMVFRSMAQTLVHDLKTAMEAVAARV